MKDINVDALRNLHASGYPVGPVVPDMLNEIESLRARLASVETERDALRRMIEATFSHFPDCEQCGGKPVDVGAPYPVCAPCLAKLDKAEDERDAANALIREWTLACVPAEACEPGDVFRYHKATVALTAHGEALIAREGKS